jgi:hypothetical protein
MIIQIRLSLRLEFELDRIFKGGFVTVRLVLVEVDFWVCCTVGLIETLRACGEGWIIALGPRLAAVEGVDAPDGRAGDDGVTRVG